MTYLQLAAPPQGGIENQWITGRRRHAVERAARAALRRSGYLALRDIDCEYDNGVLTLWGRLPSYFLKAMAQNIVSRDVGGSVMVDNQLVVTQLPAGVGTWRAD